MPAYMLTFLRVEDAETHARDYLPGGHQALLAYGGKPLAVTEDYTVKEGAFPKGRLLLVEFPSKEAAEQYYDGPEHAPYKEILHKVAKSDMVIFDSGSMPI
ncbi:MAG: DUF1330 domain-containing protein [Pseudomonadota bacterium]|jgi:uncharacterized protein (DUF1330 family)|uniref:DUF1330 domain-containing protein n=1 Tax=Thalassovita sp. TaxID=1979401 RepID=UPI002AB11E09|nr:DUF1330 domain-containing protein [Thalassovita sp.]MEC7965704.1 DUF1330 domain-containing protein [Pseudomonadota bacterium]MEC8294253.1 DUF1330 domain-containing protein [Pseudomonadota bacterium]